MGRVHSVQSLATVDGPGVRFAVFLQGCPLRCACCHNPDTWDPCGGTQMTADEVVQRALRCRAYFGRDGGITLSGGEPLLQAAFVYDVFRACRDAGIHTCLDTSGCIYNDAVERVLSVTDRVLLDIKYTTDEGYRRYVGCERERVMRFLAALNEKKIPTTLRQVVIPQKNDTSENFAALREIARTHACVDGVELLPFRKLCQEKYDILGIAFPFGDLCEPSEEEIERYFKMVHKNGDKSSLPLSGEVSAPPTEG